MREQNEVVGENEGADTGSDIGSENLPTPPESNRNPPKPIDGLSISINHSGLENCVVEDLSGGSSMYDKEYLLKWINPSQMPNGIEMDILPGLTPDQQGGYYVISLDDLYLQHMEIFDYKINIQSMRNVLIKIPADSEGILGVNTKKVVNDVWDIYPESIKPADLRAPEEEDDLDDETTSRFLDALGFGTRTPETIGYDYLTFS